MGSVAGASNNSISYATTAYMQVRAVFIRKTYFEHLALYGKTDLPAEFLRLNRFIAKRESRVVGGAVISKNFSCALDV